MEFSKKHENNWARYTRARRINLQPIIMASQTETIQLRQAQLGAHRLLEPNDSKIATPSCSPNLARDEATIFATQASPSQSTMKSHSEKLLVGLCKF